MKKKESFSVAMLGSYSCSNPSTETPYDSGYLNQNETRKGEQRAIRSSSSRQEEEEP